MPTTNDGSVPYGSFVVTIGTTAFVAENLSPSKPTNRIERRDEINEPSGQVIIPDFESATMTLQRPTTSEALPAIGATLTAPTNSGLSGTQYITDVGATFDQGEDQKFNITVHKSVA